MEFHQWQTLIDEYRRHDRSAKDKSLEELYSIEVHNILDSGLTSEIQQKRIIRLGTEQVWMESGRPYYNVHPQLVRSLCKTNLENIPVEFIEIPNSYEAVSFRFCEDVPIRYFEKGQMIDREVGLNASPIFCRSVLFGKAVYKEDDEFARVQQLLGGPKIISSANDAGHFIMVMDEGVRAKTGTMDRMLTNLFVFEFVKGMTIPQAFDYALDKRKGIEKDLMKYMQRRLLNLFRIVISGGFLANTPDEQLVVPDILKDDIPAYKLAKTQGNTERMSFLVDRARRRGKNGFNIGTNEMFVGESQVKGQQRGDGTGKELSFSHLRGGHPHAVRYGEGKSKVKIKWFRPVRVRDDLPFKVEE